MPTVRELQVRFIAREVNDPRVGEPITGLDSILRLMSQLRFPVDEEVWAVVLDIERKILRMYQVSKGGKHETSFCGVGSAGYGCCMLRLGILFRPLAALHHPTPQFPWRSAQYALGLHGSQANLKIISRLSNRRPLKS